MIIYVINYPIIYYQSNNHKNIKFKISLKRYKLNINKLNNIMIKIFLKVFTYHNLSPYLLKNVNI